MIKHALLAAALIAIGSTSSFAQGGAGGEPPRLGDANPPRNALRNGGVPPVAAIRRGDDMAPMAGQASGWNGNRGWSGQNQGWNNGWQQSGWRSGWNDGGWNNGWNNGGWNGRNVSGADPSFGNRAGINNARRTGRCVTDLGYGRYEYCGW